MQGSVKIIIIDDNQDFLFTMATFLKRNGFETITAENGKKGLELIRDQRPNLILLDIMMESLFSGFEVCKRLRSDKALKAIPIIGISGIRGELGVGYEKWEDDDYFSPDAFFEKPVEKEALLAVIKELLENKPGRSKIYQKYYYNE